MDIIYQDLKKGEIKVRARTLDDLWCLSQIIEPEDLVSGKTIRKIKLGEAEARTSIIKKPVRITLGVEKVEFHKFSNSLRVSGTIIEGPEDIPKSAYHTFDLKEGSAIKIIKKEWPKYQLNKIFEATKEKSLGILLCVLDRETATFALLKKYGYEILAELEGEVEKKGDEKQKESTFYYDLAKMLNEYVDRHQIKKIVIASPAFWKENLIKIIEKKHPELKEKIIQASCNATGKNGINEILKRGEVITALRDERVTKEISLVEELLKEIGKNELAVYGFEETKKSAEAGAIKNLLLTDEFLQKTREEGKYKQLEEVMRIVEKTKGEINIISTEHDGGKKLKGIGGIAGILKYRTNY
ncbi:mRNA surveillance protein pelota [Candidatus Woesearchaeota archaeon]|nr:mRNA surveillance protein pelota [Candidatus Woesearchaeota archaeon]